jgi:dual specificity phosphatase 12
MFVLPTGENANLIVQNLWLGNAKAAHDEEFLRKNNIFTVFNCSKDIPFHRLAKRCYRVPVDDNLRQEEIRNMELWSFEIIAKLCKELKAGHTVLVHCAAGMQRSAAVVAMYLIAVNRVSAEESMEYIREKRPIAFLPMANFQPAIKGFERELVTLLQRNS